MHVKGEAQRPMPGAEIFTGAIQPAKCHRPSSGQQTDSGREDWKKQSKSSQNILTAYHQPFQLLCRHKHQCQLEKNCDAPARSSR